MFEFEKMCSEYEDLSYVERQDLLKELADTILPAVKEKTGGTISFEVLVMASCDADGKLDDDEYALYKDATGTELSYDAVTEKLKEHNQKDLLEAADAVVDGFGDIDITLKEKMVAFCLCLCSADGRVGLRERLFIKKLVD